MVLVVERGGACVDATVGTNSGVRLLLGPRDTASPQTRDSSVHEPQLHKNNSEATAANFSTLRV